MNKPKSLRPSPGVVLGTLALIVAVVGQASAASTTKVIVRKGEIADGAVSAKALAKGAVHPKAIAKGAVTEAAIKTGAVTAATIKPGSVTAPALGGGAVGAGAIAPDAVGSGALAPGAVYGGALGEVTIHAAGIVDLDVDAHNGEWTTSNTATATCENGERVISGGVVFTNAGDRQVGIVQSVPYANGNAQGWAGQITSDSGGSATAQVQALCLK
jgi:trimeric autotransporter adhesin